jgi:uncharacterized protein
MEARAQPSRVEQTAELLVFLFLIVPSIILSFFAQNLNQAGFVLVAASTILRDLALVGLILFFLWRNGEPLDLIGWRRKGALPDVALGLLLSPLVITGIALLGGALQSMGFSGPSRPLPPFLTPHGPEQIALAVVLVVVVAISEETIFRGYLMARIGAVTGSTPVAAILSSVIFSLGHVYEGGSGVIAVGVMGLVFALLLAWRRSIVAPAVIHFANDFAGIVVLSLLVPT